MWGSLCFFFVSDFWEVWGGVVIRSKLGVLGGFREESCGAGVVYFLLSYSVISF